MATKRVGAGSTLLVFLFFFFKAYAENATSLLDNQHTSPPVIMKLTTAGTGTDGVKMAQPGTTVSPPLQYTNDRTTAVNVSSMKPDNVDTNSSASMETMTAQMNSSSTMSRPTQTFSSNNTGQIKWDEKWDKPFKYDYGFLRKIGLTIATVLFLLGIMVITCGRIRCGRRCRTGKKRSYDVSRL